MKGAGSTALCAARQYGSATEVEGQAYNVGCLPFKMVVQIRGGGRRQINRRHEGVDAATAKPTFYGNFVSAPEMPSVGTIKALCR
jgi:hypothetical protein